MRGKTSRSRSAAPRSSSRTAARATSATRKSASEFLRAARALAAVGRRFYARGWALGTGGNYSTVISAKPLRLAITASAVHKGTLGATQILEIDEHGAVRNRRAGVPSAETLLHIEIVKRLGAGAVLHTHSSWNTMLSDRYSADGGFAIEGYEMLKALDGVRTHEHREWIPIVDNDQDMTRLAPVVGEILARDPRVHAFLLRRHGLYTWGRTLADAERHVEVLEFLFETVGRMPARGTEEISHGNAESSGGGSHAARSGGDQAVFGRARHRV